MNDARHPKRRANRLHRQMRRVSLPPLGIFISWLVLWSTPMMALVIIFGDGHLWDIPVMAKVFAFAIAVIFEHGALCVHKEIERNPY